MSFARSLFTVSGLTVVSRIAGFLRDTLTAMYLGAGTVADAFFVAQRLPNLFRSLFAEGAFTAAFVPIYTTEQERHGREAAQQFAGQALMLLLAALIPFSVIVMMFMPQVMLIIAHDYIHQPEKYQLAVRFSTITFPYLALISVTALQTGVLNAQGRFGPGAAAPICFNLVLIAALFLARWQRLDVGYSLAWGVTVSGVVQCGWLAISCYRARTSIPLVKPHLGEASRRLFKRVGPGAVGAGAAQINLLISTMLATSLPTGAVSYLFYADRLNQLPLGVVGIAVATTLLPLLSRHIEAGREEHARHYMSRAIEFCLMLGLPATVGLAVAAQPIISTLFEHGVFTHADTIATSQALAAYSLGIPAFLLVKVFASGFFARHDTSTPVKVAVTAMIVNVICSLALLGSLRHIGIALANSAAVWVNAVFLYTQLRKKIGVIGDRKVVERLPRLVGCAFGMAIVTAVMVGLTRDVFEGGTNTLKAVTLVGIIGVSCILYALSLQLSGAVNFKDVLALLKRKPTINDDELSV